MKENTKAANRRKTQKIFVDRIFCGAGIEVCDLTDITPIQSFPNITSLDRINRIEDLFNTPKYSINKPQFDFINLPVFLHTYPDPIQTLKKCGDFLKPKGYLIFTVPDEDLYEVGHYPSIRNAASKHTFSIYKERSWSPVHINLLSEFQNLPEYYVVKTELVDTNLNYKDIERDQTFDSNLGVECFIESVLQKL